MNRLARLATLSALGLSFVVVLASALVMADDKADTAVAAAEVKLVPVKWTEFQTKLASFPKSKLILVDAWATWCGPCKENFPHVVEMHHKYASKGLSVISLSLDDPEKPKKITEAEKFLKEKKAVITNLLLNETADEAFDKLNINAIPAVFLFSPDGKEIKRFTLDDPNNQFTYEQVEKEIQKRLEAK